MYAKVETWGLSLHKKGVGQYGAVVGKSEAEYWLKNALTTQTRQERKHGFYCIVEV